jgi:hypothetical protein
MTKMFAMCTPELRNCPPQLSRTPSPALASNHIGNLNYCRQMSCASASLKALRRAACAWHPGSRCNAAAASAACKILPHSECCIALASEMQALSR